MFEGFVDLYLRHVRATIDAAQEMTIQWQTSTDKEMTHWRLGVWATTHSRSGLRGRSFCTDTHILEGLVDYMNSMQPVRNEKKRP